MQFNSGTDAILDDIDFLCETSSTSYPIADKTRNVNRWAYKAHVAQIMASDRWQIDDSNLSTLPWLTTTLVAGQGDYTLPSGYLRVNRVEVMDSNGDYHKLTSIDQSDVTEAYTEHEETDGLPKYYDLIGNVINLKPSPASSDVTLTAGLRLHILREIDIFTTSDTDQEPGFPEPFHRIVVYGACYDFLSRPGGDKEAANTYRQEVEVLLKEMSQFTALMNGGEHIRIRPAHRTSAYL